MLLLFAEFQLNVKYRTIDGRDLANWPSLVRLDSA